jgi:3-oxoacyl-ACP reductase-like protein
VRESRTPGSVRGVLSNGHPYRVNRPTPVIRADRLRAAKRTLNASSLSAAAGIDAEVASNGSSAGRGLACRSAGANVVGNSHGNREPIRRCRLQVPQRRKEVIDVYELQVRDGSSASHWD